MKKGCPDVRNRQPEFSASQAMRIGNRDIAAEDRGISETASNFFLPIHSSRLYLAANYSIK